MSTDTPDIASISEGNEYRIRYTSTRTGNEQTRTATATSITEDADTTVVKLYEKQRDCLKHTLIGLVETETKTGDECVAAYSMTIESEPPNGDEPPRLGQVYTVTFEKSRTTLLGVVDLVVNPQTLVKL